MADRLAIVGFAPVNGSMTPCAKQQAPTQEPASDILALRLSAQNIEASIDHE
ncbi:MAG: hypothetical protein ABI192_13125 [Bradyrhizobium sp.]